MSTTLRQQRRSGSARRFRLESLESRLVLSSTAAAQFATSSAPVVAQAAEQTTLGPNLTILGITPSAGSKVTTSPTTLEVSFDRSIDPFSYGFDDIRVDQQQSDGSWLPILNYGDSVLNESLDQTGTILELSLDSSLSLGTYRLVLPAFSGLAGLDGSTFADTSNDVDLGHFSVVRPGVTLDDATDVGPVNPTSPGVGNSTSSWSANINGSLDFTSNPYAVNLYEITVPQGHYWRLGAEVESQRLGGWLQSAVTVFDSQGNVVKFSNAGRPSTPNDAYVYTGLGPGTYYIGVSGTGNIPGSQYNGYNPVTGDPGTVAQTLSGGSYTLQLSLDTADTPTRLVSSTLNYADPLDTTPTGLTLAFNGVLDAQSIRGQPTSGFVLTNQSGQTFPLTVVGVNEATGQYTFLFDNKLPAGHYTLNVAPTNGAKDLAGLSPVPTHPSDGAIMKFEVKPSVHPDPSDLGAFNNNIHKGVSFEASLAPGTAETYRFVLTNDGLYHFQTLFASGQVQLIFLGGGSNGAWISAGQEGASNVLDKYLKAGVYLISFRNVGSVTADLNWSIRLNQAWDSFFDNGIGQTSALSLRLVDSSGSGNPSGTISSPAGPMGVASTFGPFSPGGAPNDPGGRGIASTPTATGATTTTTASPANAATSLSISFGDTLVGRPSTASDHVSVAASEGGNGIGIGALATLGNGIPQGIGVGQTIGASRSRLSPSSRLAAEIVAEAKLAAEAALEGEIDGAIVSEPVVAPPKVDELVVATSDWLDQLGALAARFLQPRPSEAAELSPEIERAEKIALTRDDVRRPQGHVESASVGAPAIVGFVAAAGIRYYKRIRKHAPRLQKAHPDVFRGPHGKF